MTEKTIKILLVDDHLVVRNGLRLMLASEPDFEIAAEAETAAQAMALVRKTRFDVVMLDIGLPDKNGLEVLKQMKDEQADIKVLMFSIYAEDMYAVRALKLGASGYLSKTTPAETLIAAIRKAASGGKYVSEFLAEKLANTVDHLHRVAHETLSNRELEVMKRLAVGDSLVQIGEMLHLSPSTITTYRARILEKLSLRSNAELARYALENGLLS